MPYAHFEEPGTTNRHGERSFLYVFFACLSLGLFFCWINFLGSAENVMFEQPADSKLGHALSVRIATGLTFIFLSFLPTARPRPFVAWSSAIIAVLGAIVSWGSAYAGSIMFVIAGVLAGVSLAIFLYVWLSRYCHDPFWLLVMLLLTPSLTSCLYPSILLLGKYISLISLILLPIVSVLIFSYAPGHEVAVPGKSQGNSLAKPGLALQVLALLLCNSASGSAAYGLSTSIEDTLRLAALISLVLSIAVVLRWLNELKLFVVFSLFACGCVACMLLMPGGSAPSWLPNLTAAGFWMLTKYSIAWFAINKQGANGDLSPAALRGIAAVYLLTAIAEMASHMVPAFTSQVIGLIEVGLSLGISLISTARTTTYQAATLSLAATETPATANQQEENVLSVLSEQADLTESERGVFKWLAKGYSLRQVAAELGITENAAKYHRHNIYQKLNVSSRQELINLVDKPKNK